MTFAGPAAAAHARRRPFARRHLAVRAAAVALLALAGGAPAASAAAPPAAPAPAAQPAGPTRIGVVNTQRVFNEMQETQAMNARMGEAMKALDNEDRERGAALQKMQKELAEGGLKPGSPQWERANAEYIDAAIKYKVWRESEKAKSEWAYKRQVKQLFDKVQAAVAEVSQNQGFDLVIADTGGEKLPDDLSQISLPNLKALLLQKSVMYAGPKSDITGMVILVLDAKYKSAGGK